MARRNSIQDMGKIVAKWLRSKGCYVMNTESPSLMFFKEGFYGAIEVKASKSSPCRPGQKETIDKFNEWSWGKIVWGGKDSNWKETRKELEEML